jgi:hypothetical protein
MSRATQTLAFLVLFSASAAAAFLPEALGAFNRSSLEIYEPENIEIFREFGFDEGEKAVYITPAAQQLEISALRFRDATGAFAAFQWSHPAKAKSVAYGQRAAQAGDLTVIQFGNYVVHMKGAAAVDEHVEVMLGFLPRVQMSPEPPLLAFVPRDGLIPDSERYILGPLALREVAPGIPPSVAAFHFGTEAQFGRYENAAGEIQLALFSYPSPQIARGQIEEFRTLPNVVAKRTGPLIAAVISPPSADQAQFLLAKISYTVQVTPTPHDPGRHENIGTLILDIVFLCLILIGLMIVGGLAVAGSRMLARRYAPNSLFASSEGPDMIRLDIEKRS